MIDTSLLLCGVLSARTYFDDPKIKSLATQNYERVDWPWMLNSGKTFSMGWHPGEGFLDARWEHFCELMMIYLLAIGSPTHPVPAEYWKHWTRPVIHYDGFTFISGNDPIFTHQYSHAWFDFRHKRDDYANYFENSVTATKAHKAFCLSYPKWYNEDYWGVSASDYRGGYTAWGGPPAQGPLDEPWFHAHQPARSPLFPQIASPSSAPCATNGASRRGAATVLSMRSIPRQTGTTPVPVSLGWNASTKP